MAAKGTVAKQQVINKIQKTFGSDFIGEVDKKIYVWAQENGEKVQIAISLTCPKAPVAVANVPTVIPVDESNEWNFEEMSITTTPPPKKPVVFSAEEEKNIEDLIKKLGL